MVGFFLKLNMRPLSWLQLYWLVFGEIFLVGTLILASYFWGVVPTGDMLVYSSILLGATGTALMVLPSTITTFGRTEGTEEYKDQFQAVRDAFNRLSEGETLTESDEGYQELVEYMDDIFGFEKYPSEIRLCKDVSPPLFNFDGENQLLPASHFLETLEAKEENIRESESRISEIRERNHAIAGGVLYGFAIILQGINTLI